MGRSRVDSLITLLERHRRMGNQGQGVTEVQERERPPTALRGLMGLWGLDSQRWSPLDYPYGVVGNVDQVERRPIGPDELDHRRARQLLDDCAGRAGRPLADRSGQLYNVVHLRAHQNQSSRS